MVISTASMPEDERKPRLGIMGEFSAGKSTLSNLLLATSALPVKVTATQLPPVWISYGTKPPRRVDIHGGSHPVDFEDVSKISLADTQFIRIDVESDFLKQTDVIDFPGISDPNMPPEVWERAAHLVDAVIWCTHANQAWRQSEAAVWEELSDSLAMSSLLLVTRMDKIQSLQDRDRLMARLQREAASHFREIIPISLTDALLANKDTPRRQNSGAAELFEALEQVLSDLENTPREDKAPRRPPQEVSEPKPANENVCDAHPQHHTATPVQSPTDKKPGITPRRVTLRKSPNRIRPPG